MTMEVWMLLVAVAAGYVGSIYSWPTIKVLANGVATEAASLRAKAFALEAKIKAL